jgi:hypothetical protein
MNFPENDDQFEDKAIESVTGDAPGKYAITCDGGTLWCGENCTDKPQPGQIARQYGRGIGSTVRGLFIDGQKIWYRTEAEEAERSEIQMYGADAADWLKRWDDGRVVWSIEMGGMGPGYEQCIHITAAEVLRYLIANKVDCETQYAGGAWSELSSAINKLLWATPAINDLDLSGAQAGAAKSLATQLYRDGPRAVMNNPDIKHRRIQVSKNFPGMKAA